jgi:hypothetical protein
MKKLIVLILVFILTPLFSMAQYPDWKNSYSDIEKPSWNEVKGSCALHSSYNFLEKSFIAGTRLCCDIGYVRGEIEIGWSYIQTLTKPIKDHFYYVSMCIGPAIGNKNKFYALIGGSTWPDYDENSFYTSSWRLKANCGYDIYLSKKTYFNLSLAYIMPYRNSNLISAKHLSLGCGIGIKF